MRKINFRAWDKQLKRWTYALHVNGNGTIRVCPDGYPNNYICLEDSDRFEVVKFTGIQDVTGKDIYEGDIVSCEYQNKKYIDVVKWNDEIIGYDPFCTPCDYDEVYYPKNKIILIGNIYENSELLKQGRETLNGKIVLMA